MSRARSLRPTAVSYRPLRCASVSLTPRSRSSTPRSASCRDRAPVLPRPRTSVRARCGSTPRCRRSAARSRNGGVAATAPRIANGASPPDVTPSVAFGPVFGRASLRESGRGAESRCADRARSWRCCIVPELTLGKRFKFAQLREAARAVLPQLDSPALCPARDVLFAESSSLRRRCSIPALVHYDVVALRPASPDRAHGARGGWYRVDDGKSELGARRRRASRGSRALERDDDARQRFLAGSAARALPHTSPLFASAALAAPTRRPEGSRRRACLRRSSSRIHSPPTGSPAARGASAGELLLQMGDGARRAARSEMPRRYPRAWNALKRARAAADEWTTRPPVARGRTPCRCSVVPADVRTAARPAAPSCARSPVGAWSLVAAIPVSCCSPARARFDGLRAARRGQVRTFTFRRPGCRAACPSRRTPSP